MAEERRVVFFGTPDIAAGTLEALLAAGVTPVAAVVQPDKPRGRDHRVPLPAPVKTLAEAHGIPVFQPATCKDPAFLQTLAELDADVFLVVAFGQLLPQRLLDLPRLGCFNAHASLLPRWRGSAPINWAILAGDTHTGMAIQRMRFKLDSGPVVWRRELAIGTDNAERLRARLTPLAGEGFLAVLAALADDTLTEEEQDEAGVTLAPKLTKEQGLVDWSRPAAEIDRQVRGLAPWPGAYTLIDGQGLKLHAAEVLDEPTDAAPGTVCRVGAAGLDVATGAGLLRLLDVQRDGKKRMNAQAFLCGCSLKPGFVLGR